MKLTLIRYCLISIALWIGVHTTTSAADTLFISMQTADTMFVKNNLLLLAEAYNIDATKALELNAKAYPNPVFTVDLNVYDPQNNIPFHVGSTGQKQFILEQLILIGGKRKTEIDIAKTNTQLAQLEFEDLLRQMYFELHVSFFRLHQEYQTIRLYNEQIALIDTLVRRYEVQVAKGNIPMKDFTRLNSIYFKFNNERTAVFAKLVEELNRIQIMLRSTNIIVPIVEEKQFLRYTSQLYADSLEIDAYANRPDYKVANEEVQLSLLQLKLQRKMVIPDVKLNFSYDQRGGAFVNQFNSGFTIPLPLWSFNRGMVKYSKAKVSVTETYLELKKSEIHNEVWSAFYSWQTSLAEYQNIILRYNSDFQLVYTGMKDNFAKRNISIVEFADFVESYNETVTILEIAKAQLAINGERINLVTSQNQY